MNQKQKAEKAIQIIHYLYDVDATSNCKKPIIVCYKRLAYYLVLKQICLPQKDAIVLLKKSRNALSLGCDNFQKKLRDKNSIENDLIKEVDAEFKNQTGLSLLKPTLSKVKPKKPRFSREFSDLLSKIPEKDVPFFIETRLKPYLLMNKL